VGASNVRDGTAGGGAGHGLEAADAPLGEVRARGERLDAQREALHFEADARHFRHEPLEHGVVQRVPLGLCALTPASRRAASRFTFPCAFNAAAIGLGLKNSFSSGLRSLRRNRSSPLCVS
jgi:hypothetical protein